MAMNNPTLVRPVPPTPPQALMTWVWTVLATLVAGVGLKEALQPTLAAIVGGAAGAIASYGVEWVRVWLYEFVNRAALAQTWYGKWFAYWLYNPRGIRGTVLAVTLVLGALASGLLEWSTGKPVSAAVAAAWAFIGSQIAHLRSLPNQPAILNPVGNQSAPSAEIASDSEAMEVTADPSEESNKIAALLAEIRLNTFKRHLAESEEGSAEHDHFLAIIQEEESQNKSKSE